MLLALVLWSQPIYEQLTGHPGNVTSLVQSLGVAPPSTPTFRQTVVVLGGTLAQPPFWFPPGFVAPTFKLNGTGRPLPLDVVSLLVLAAIGTWLAVEGARRHDRVSVAGLVTVLAGLVWGAATILDMPLRQGLAPTYLRWLWPYAMFVWLVLATAALRSFQAARAARTAPIEPPADASAAADGRERARPRWARTGAVAAVAVAAAFGALSVRTVDNGNASPVWAMAAGKELSTEVVPMVRHRGTVLVQPSIGQAGGGVGPMIMAELQAHGIPFVVSDEALVRQLGEPRRYDGSNATTRLVITDLVPGSRPPAGLRLVGFVPALNRAQGAELDALKLRLVERLGALHGIPLGTGLDHAPRPIRARFRAWAAAAGRDAKRAIAEGDLLGMYVYGRVLGRPVIDVAAIGAGVLHRYAVLQDLDDRASAVLIGPISN